jgi:hypothetical protein
MAPDSSRGLVHVCIYVCINEDLDMCVCVRERERERERVVCVCVCVCVCIIKTLGPKHSL